MDDLGEGYEVHYDFGRIRKYTSLILNDSRGISGGLGGVKHQGVCGSVVFCPRNIKGSEVEQLSSFWTLL